LKGFVGEEVIRMGSRRVSINVFSTISFILDPHIVYRESLIARAVDRTRSLQEARYALNSLGIYTEYDLEEDISELDKPVEEIEGDDLIRIRENGRKRLLQLLTYG